MIRPKRSKLTQPEIQEFIKLHKSGKTYREIGSALGISCSSVNHQVTVVNHGFRNTMEYFDYLAQRKGYSSHSDYRTAVNMARNPSDPPTSVVSEKRRKQREFEKEMLSINGLDFQEPFGDFSDLLEAMDNLASVRPRQYFVIFERFFAGRELSDIGAELRVSRQRVHQLELKAIQRIRTYFNK